MTEEVHLPFFFFGMHTAVRAGEVILQPKGPALKTQPNCHGFQHGNKATYIFLGGGKKCLLPRIGPHTPSDELDPEPIPGDLGFI